MRGTIALALFGFIAASGAYGCSGKSTPQKPPIAIGMVSSLTGSFASTTFLEGVQLAFEEINAHGGVLGTTLSIESRDDKSDTDTTTAVTKELVDLGVPAIIGPINSTRFLAAANVTIPAKRVQIGGAATAPSISDLPADGYIFRTIASDTLAAKFIAGRALMQGHRNIALVFVDSAYGHGLAVAFVASFGSMGGVVTSSVAYQENLPSYRDVLSKVYSTATAPDAILLVPGAPQPAAQIFSDYLDAFAGKGTFWYLPGLVVPRAITMVGADKITFPHEIINQAANVDAPTYKTFAAAYKARFSHDNQSAAPNFYDAAYVLALAIVSAGSAQPAMIRDKLHALGHGAANHYDATQYSAAAADAAAGKIIKYDGASGDCVFDEHGDVINGFSIAKVVNGQVTVTTPFIMP